MLMKQQIAILSNREDVPKYIKYKESPEGSHLVKYKKEKEYEYYKCDYCGEEIIIKDKREKQDGGIALLPNTITNRGNIKIALHNRCLNPLLRNINNKNDKKKIKILSLFSGIGAFEKALKNIGKEYELIGFSEIDKYAIKSYCTIHNVSENKNLGDITKIKPKDLPQNIDLITHGSPCQDFSIAGKQAGAEKGSGTRSSLMWNTVDIIKECLPQYVIWENVKNVLSKKHKHNFDNYIEVMEQLGYNNYYKVLNAKDYGIPQNRERIYTISIRKDIDNNKFAFPEKEKLKLKLKDLLEEEVDEKYYLSDEQMKNFIRNNNGNCNPSGKGMNGRVHLGNIAPTLTTNKGEGVKVSVEVTRKYGIFDTEKNKHQAGSVYDKNGLCPTLDTMQGGWRQPCIEIKNATKKGYINAEEGDAVNLSYPNSETRRGRVGKQVSQTLQCNDLMGVIENERN